MNKEIVDFTETQLKDLFSKAGLNSQDIDKAIADYIRYRESEISSLSILSYNDLQKVGAEAFTDGLRTGVDIVEAILRNYLRYLNYKKEIAETYQESKSWDKVITTAVYSDVKEAQESFIDYIEETYQTKVKDGKHLQKLTGITEETLEGLEETITASRYSKYYRALEKALQEGGKYKDLLKIKPQDYGLSKTWSGCLGSDQYSSILWAIDFEFNISEPNTSVRPDLRVIAQEIEAPYSVLMDAHKICNEWKLRS